MLGRSLFHLGITTTATEHYHSSRLIGKILQPMHTFFSNARWLTEGTQIAEMEKRDLEFITALMRLKWRDAPIVEDAVQRIEVGEFDIEIEG
jgi:hypothetical protein